MGRSAILQEAYDFLDEQQRIALGQQDQWAQLAVVEKGPGQLVGDARICIKSPGNAAEIGFTIAPAFRRRGYGAEACRAAIDCGALAGRLTIAVIASGGIMDGAGIARALRAGARAVQMRTAFLACDEAGTSKPYRAALLHGRGEQTVVTRAFSGRHARGLRNAFIDRVGEREELILPYPIQNSLTRPMRAAAAQGKAEYLSLWAGTGVATPLTTLFSHHLASPSSAW